VRNIDGLEWLGEIEEEDIPPDDDFFVADREGAPREGKMLRGRAFLIFTNQQALQQLLSLWDTWKAGNALPRGLGKWADVFAQLRDVRPWGVQDRLIETGILDDWRERVAHNNEVIPCEIELWFRNDPRRRRSARDRVVGLVDHVGEGQDLLLDVGREAEHGHDLGHPGAGDALPAGDGGLVGGLAGRQ
jgi:hypothetical protein